MPSISKNKQVWGETYLWPQGGDEWSKPFGTAHAQWFGSLSPRVFPFLKGRILEIAPGHGRWTQFLQVHCTSLIGIDLVQACVDRCTERFSQYPHLEFKVNDGMTLPTVESGTIDFAFSFGSLVHAEADVMSSYVNELARVLKPGGVAFLHHSNLNAVLRRSVLLPARKVVMRLARLPDSSTGFHARSMSAGKMRKFVERAGMTCLQQEISPSLGSGSSWMIDCISTIVNAPGGPCCVVKNSRIKEEADAIKRISSLRTAASQDGA